MPLVGNARIRFELAGILQAPFGYPRLLLVARAIGSRDRNNVVPEPSGDMPLISRCRSSPSRSRDRRDRFGLTAMLHTFPRQSANAISRHETTEIDYGRSKRLGDMRFGARFIFACARSLDTSRLLSYTPCWSSLGGTTKFDRR